MFRQLTFLLHFLEAIASQIEDCTRTSFTRYSSVSRLLENSRSPALPSSFSRALKTQRLDCERGIANFLAMVWDVTMFFIYGCMVELSIVDSHSL